MIEVRWVVLGAVLALAACGEQEPAQTTPEPKATTTKQMQAPATTEAPKEVAPEAAGNGTEVDGKAAGGEGSTGGSPASE